MRMEEIKKDVTRRVHKEYREFIDKVLRSGKWYAIDNALMISFYKEIHIYVLNDIVKDDYYMEMHHMKRIISTLWERFSKNTIDKHSTHFLSELMEFHKKNKDRMDINAKALKGEEIRCQIG